MDSSLLKINKLKELLEASKLLNSTQDTDYILEFLLKKSLELIKGGDTGVIFIYNKDTEMLEIRAFVGFDSNITEVNLYPGESMTGIAFQKQETMFFNNPHDIKIAMGTMREKNMKILQQSLNKKQNELLGSICCPLIYREECIGVIVIDNFENHVALNEEDVSLLEAISVQATIAIINAQNYERQLKNNADLEKYNKMLKSERNKYKYSTGLHSRFTEMILNGCSVEDIILETSSLLKRDIFIIDLFYNISNYVFSYYTDIDTVKSINYNLIKYLRENKTSKYFNDDKNLHFYFSPIMVNRDTLGWLCIVADNDEYSELDNITVERSVTILALELLKLNELSNMEQTLKGDFLDSLIVNQNKDYIVKCAKNYGFRFDMKHQIIVIEVERDKVAISEEEHQKKFNKYIRYYYSVINEKINRIFNNSIALIKGNKIIIILQLDNDNNKDKIKLFLENIVTENNISFFTRYGNKKVRAGVSDEINSLENFKTSYSNAIQAVRMTKNIEGENLYYFYDDLEIKKMLLNNDKKDLEYFISKTLGPLLNYKKNTRNEYLETLKIYIKSNGNWTYTKDYLHIHGNTLSYRLKRIMDLLNIDLNDYNQRLRVQIAFEILDILPVI
ncbi:helix-turn-helix domain-containing protein [Paramaledivibacter caminithermalis]|uniref:Sugar diacid utilization regulator n=1 Tax=Paramaledivibacter caminithermalis (strain DSM 15212 / CIP 107654 / DViRD3) TaxID=1121301 RepID=A0A1M6SI27_PARC5|nr:helix-turn-helix domain-containing protein [Paramaledivibacter caminithermalis]SHK44335.1 Sugar diacid utilization regulator [Paramaledivibacter caminithermalis DSM 15212]